jgi:hypothetical protein
MSISAVSLPDKRSQAETQRVAATRPVSGCAATGASGSQIWYPAQVRSMVVRHAIRGESLANPHDILKGIKPEDLLARRRHGDGYPNVSEGPSRAGW